MKRPKDRPMTYSVDFDGTIVTDKFPDIGKPVPQVVAFVKKIQARGDKWILWTCRTKENLDKAVEFCHSIGLYPDAVNDNLPSVIEFLHGENPRKPMVDIQIDDHNAKGLQIPIEPDDEEPL